MRVKREDMVGEPIIIDLSSERGNAFWLLNAIGKLAKEIYPDMQNDETRKWERDLKVARAAWVLQHGGTFDHRTKFRARPDHPILLEAMGGKKQFFIDNGKYDTIVDTMEKYFGDYVKIIE